MSGTPAPLPHAYPFRFVDTIARGAGPLPDAARTTLETGWDGTVLVRVSANGRASMGGPWQSPLLIAEAIAQAVLLLVGEDAEAGRRGFLAGIDSFEVSRPPRPGESLTIHVRLSARFGAIAKFQADVTSGAETIGRGAILVRRGDG